MPRSPSPKRRRSHSPGRRYNDGRRNDRRDDWRRDDRRDDWRRDDRRRDDRRDERRDDRRRDDRRDDRRRDDRRDSRREERRDDRRRDDGRDDRRDDRHRDDRRDGRHRDDRRDDGRVDRRDERPMDSRGEDSSKQNIAAKDEPGIVSKFDSTLISEQDMKLLEPQQMTEEESLRLQQAAESLLDDSDEEDEEAIRAREAEARKKKLERLKALKSGPAGSKVATSEPQKALSTVATEDDSQQTSSNQQENQVSSENDAGVDMLFSDAPLPAAERDESLLIAPELADEGGALAAGGHNQIEKAAGVEDEPMRKVANQDANEDNWDDAEGYLAARVGELLANRFKVTSAVGKGVFSTVLKCRDLETGALVAIKVIRRDAADHMYNAGRKEIQLLQEIVKKDPEQKRHVIRLLDTFEYKNHLCMVFESMHINLRELLKQFGAGVGIKIDAVRQYAKQLLVALKHLDSLRIMHADLKPDNIVINESLTSIRVCDLGSADKLGPDPIITPYQQSRFYRAPEIILGVTYNTSMDIWSAGCCLFELYTGKFMFPGRSNNEMLKFHMEVRGAASKKLLRRGKLSGDHFEEDLEMFKYKTTDKVTGNEIIQHLRFSKPQRPIIKLLQGARIEKDDGTRKALIQLADLLEKMLTLDPNHRISAGEALKHSFFTMEQ